MLSTLRDASKGWISKILLLLLVLSFAVWGISDQLSGGIGGASVVETGDTKVSAVEYRLAYDRQRSILSQRLGQRITNEQARLFNIDGQVLGRLVGGAVLDEQARVMKLGLSEDRLASLIAEDEAFQGLSGQFDRNQFRSVLRNVGMREQDYITSRQQAAIRQQVAEAVSDGMEVPDTFLNALFQFQGQTRDITFIEVDESSLPEVSNPDSSILSAYFDENIANYRAPEYRAFKIVKLTAESIVDEAAISDADVRDEYDNNTARYSTPETRTVQQLVFSSKEDASVARERILAGETFEAAIEAAGRTLADVTLGKFNESDVPDSAIGDAAFALTSTTDISPVVDGTFGPILVRVSEINAEDVQPFANVSSEIRRDLALLEAQDVLLNVHDSYEDARAAGSTIDEAAASQKLEIQEFDGIDRQGLNSDGQEVDLGEEGLDIIRAVFEADIGVENQPLAAGRDGFIWYELTDVIEDRDRTLDEVRAQAVQDWIAAEKSKMLDAEANRLSDAIKTGSLVATLAEEKGYRTESKFGLARGADDADFGQAGVGEVFSAAPNGIGFTAGATGNRRLVFKIDTINNPLGDSEALQEQQVANTSNSLRGDFLDQMINRLQLEFPVSVNQAAIQQALQYGNNGHGGM